VAKHRNILKTPLRWRAFPLFRTASADPAIVFSVGGISTAHGGGFVIVTIRAFANVAAHAICRKVATGDKLMQSLVVGAGAEVFSPERIIEVSNENLEHGRKREEEEERRGRGRGRRRGRGRGRGSVI